MTTFRFPAKNNPPGATMAEGGGRAPAPAAKVPSVFRRFLVRVNPAERLVAADGKDKDEARPALVAGGGGGEAEVGSVALDRMVLSFMEDTAATVDQRPPRGRCSNCFNGGGLQDASDDEDFDFLPSSSAPAAAKPPAAGDALELIKGLVQCASAAERALLADASRIAERCGKQNGGRKKAEVRRAVAAGLRSLGYDAAVCRSRWDKGPSYPAGEHEYIDALLVATADSSVPTRVVVEVNFRGEFEVARPTKPYRAALQALPPLFVGTPDRLGKIVVVVAEAARQSLRKRGLHFPPWRKAEYMRAKWLAPHSRSCDEPAASAALPAALPGSGEVELRLDDKVANVGASDDGDKKEEMTVVLEPEEASKQEQSPVPQPQAQASKGKVVTGLASVLS